ncbi:transcription termination/antitermination protein NusA [Verrucomicrobiota bacterium]|nr:transcription termination/antitermination protein NusA [Verrucomicrobiota bacterium]
MYARGAATGTDAGATGLPWVGGVDGDFGAVAWVTRHGGDFDRFISDFGYFELQEAPNEIRVGAGKNEFTTALGVVANFEE